MMTRFTIEVYSDTCCPWCYMGKKYLDRAIEDYKALHPDAVFELVWRPFYLNPTAGVSGTSVYSSPLELTLFPFVR